MVNTSKTITDVNEVFEALEAWINQRPGLDSRNYGHGQDGARAYRQELRSIARDKVRAIKALDEARALEPRPELLADAFRAFSGRLQWNGERLDYCTGQYWPTEYRKAAASVLESYISAVRQAIANESPQTFTYTTLEDVIAANRSIGGHWFDKDTMRFFNTKLESGLIAGKFFITSERMDETRSKRYSVRVAHPDGSIDTLGKFQEHATKEDARKAIEGAR